MKFKAGDIVKVFGSPDNEFLGLVEIIKPVETPTETYWNEGQSYIGKIIEKGKQDNSYNFSTYPIGTEIQISEGIDGEYLQLEILKTLKKKKYESKSKR